MNEFIVNQVFKTIIENIYDSKLENELKREKLINKLLRNTMKNVTNRYFNRLTEGTGHCNSCNELVIYPILRDCSGCLKTNLCVNCYIECQSCGIVLCDNCKNGEYSSFCFVIENISFQDDIGVISDDEFEDDSDDDDEFVNIKCELCFKE